MSLTIVKGRIFDGTRLRDGRLARFRNGVFDGFAEGTAGADEVMDLGEDILSPGYVDLQVNGGDGLMFNDDPSVQTLSRMAMAHRGLGALRVLPTLITDTPAKTRAAIEATVTAVAQPVPGIAGLHLEGPHLSVARKGAHDADLIRTMSDDDLAALLDARARLPRLKVTIAPESVSLEQVTQLAQAGVLLSLGHTDADFDTCLAYARAGVRCVTHLFNAMSQMGNRAPGLVGAALSSEHLYTGLIADGIHVHPAMMRLAWQAKAKPARMYLVSDAMAVAGTDLDGFDLEGRRITRRDGQLRLGDGTLAGADLDLTRALFVLVNEVGVPLEEALAAATRTPAEICDLDAGVMRKGATRIADLIRIDGTLKGAEPVVPWRHLPKF